MANVTQLSYFLQIYKVSIQSMQITILDDWLPQTLNLQNLLWIFYFSSFVRGHKWHATFKDPRLQYFELYLTNVYGYYYL